MSKSILCFGELLCFGLKLQAISDFLFFWILAEPEPAAIQINDEPISSVPDNNTNIDVDKSADTWSDHSSAIESSIRTPEVATPYYTGAPGGEYLDRGQSPVSRDEIVSSYVNETSYVSPTAASNPFGAPEAVAPSVPAASTQLFPKNDEFDAFSAKFDSVKKEEATLLDGFGVTESGYKSPAPLDGKFKASVAMHFDLNILLDFV